MAPQDMWPLACIVILGGTILFYVLRVRNPKLTTVTIGPLFLYLVAGVLGVGQLYVMGTMIISVCAVCCIFSFYSLRRVEVTRTVTTPVTCGDPLEARVEVANHDWMPKLFLRVRCPLPQWLAAERDTFVIAGLWPGQKAVFRLPARALKRGCYALPPLDLIGSDPLDVFPRVAHRPLPAEVVVYPSVEDAPGMELWGDDLFGALPAQRALRPAQGLDFRSLRDYQPGDDVRTIDWKATARLSRMVVVEFEPTQVGDLLVLVDNRPEVQAGEGPDSTLEHAVSIAAGALSAVLEARGSVRLRWLQAGGAGEVFGRGSEHGPRFLDALARIEPAAGTLSELAPEDARGQLALLITADTGTAAAAAVREIAAAGARPVVLLLDAAGVAGPGAHPEVGAAEEAAGALRDIGARVLVISHSGAVLPLRQEVAV